MHTNAWCAESGQLNFVGCPLALLRSGSSRVGEERERRRPLRIRGHHVQRLLADLVRQVQRDRGCCRLWYGSIAFAAATSRSS
jgi:hypothetical protein